REPFFPEDAYSEDDPRLRALVKEAWMRTLYGSPTYQIAKDQRKRYDLGQGWDAANLMRFLTSVPGWKTVKMFLDACRAIGGHADVEYGGVVFHDPLDDNVLVRWHRPARKVKPLTARSKGPRTFTFYIDVPAHPPKDGEFRVDSRKMRDCIAPRLVHMLDATLNALVIEKLASGSMPKPMFAAVHDAWLLAASTTNAPVDDEILTDVAEMGVDDDDGTLYPYWTVRGEALLRWALDRAAKDWFESLEPVYEDLIRYLDDTEFSSFAHKIKARWERRRDDCHAGRREWP